MSIATPLYLQYYGLWLVADFQMKVLNAWFEAASAAQARLPEIPAPLDMPRVESTPV